MPEEEAPVEEGAEGAEGAEGVEGENQDGEVPVEGEEQAQQ